jgi:hypothetical protein
MLFRIALLENMVHLGALVWRKTAIDKRFLMLGRGGVVLILEVESVGPHDIRSGHRGSS